MTLITVARSSAGSWSTTLYCWITSAWESEATALASVSPPLARICDPCRSRSLGVACGEHLQPQIAQVFGVRWARRASRPATCAEDIKERNTAQQRYSGGVPFAYTAPKSRKSSACGGPGGRAGRRLVRRISTDRSPASFPWPPKPWRRRATGHRELPFPPMDPVLFSERTMPDSGGRSHRLRETRPWLAPKSRKSSACGGPGGRAGRRLVRRISKNEIPRSSDTPAAYLSRTPPPNRASLRRAVGQAGEQAGDLCGGSQRTGLRPVSLGRRSLGEGAQLATANYLSLQWTRSCSPSGRCRTVVGEVTDFARLVHGWPTGILRTSRPQIAQVFGVRWARRASRPATCAEDIKERNTAQQRYSGGVPFAYTAPKSRKSSACGGPGGRAGRRLVRRISSSRSRASFPWPPKPWRKRATGHRELPFPPMDPVLFSERTMPDSGGRSHRLRETRPWLADRHPPHKSPRANSKRGKTCASLGADPRGGACGRLHPL